MDLFHFDRASGVPAHVQLKEQVKVALALGKLRPGDLLPSIRKVEEELGIGRMLARKAYQQLQAAGLVRLLHGKGAVITGDGIRNGRHTRRAETLAHRFLAELRREGLEPVSFARFFQQRVLAGNHRPTILYVDSSEILAREIGRQVQQALGVQVRALSVAQLRSARREIPASVHVLVNYYYLEDVRKIVPERRRNILPVSWDYASSFIDRLRALRAESQILFLIYGERPGHRATRLAIDDLLSRVQERRFRTEIRPVEQVGRLESLLRSRNRTIVVSNQIWERHQALFERYPKRFWRLAARLDEQSLQAAVDKLGLVV